MTFINLSWRLVAVSAIDIAGSYRLSAFLFEHANPVRWLSVEIFAFSGFLLAALLSTVVLLARVWRPRLDRLMPHECGGSQIPTQRLERQKGGSA